MKDLENIQQALDALALALPENFHRPSLCARLMSKPVVPSHELRRSLRLRLR